MVTGRFARPGSGIACYHPTAAAAHDDGKDRRAGEGRIMTGKEFLAAVANAQTDVIRALLGVLEEARAAHCVIGGLAVNAYAEPVVSLDVDIVVGTADIESVRRAAESRGFEVQPFEHSVNLSRPGSDLRVQIQTDPRYQAFLDRAVEADLLGYRMRVARREDVLQGKIWAWSDARRRRSKRQKDLADIMRLVEADPSLAGALPDAVREAIGGP
ncbi:MAG: nucleotidyl transferase AbiEii/AbiGii toxin family protein [Myxococcota bacterium]|nr:nucleotidyl transferase AbiEii/AbiGii toxin family protein [Myxococcota bacterium]